MKMFFEMRFLNDTSQMRDTSFIRNRKEWGKSKIEGERERERERERMGEE